ncbi:hypothetical protein CRG98_030364 [Punica granatum]|uniref:Uncharacterized protein n=1 Tax=Punica granatum TaxID=22663 RepID=A0A2I0IZ43_PUNGR|nr:hypothetical protein CRG98_030364 [Punica granatum]
MAYIGFHEFPLSRFESFLACSTSGYEERVGEVFESRVTRLNAWKGARVQRMHVRARMGAGLGVREHARARQGVRRGEGAQARGRSERGRAACRRALEYCSPESMVVARNEEINLK